MDFGTTQVTRASRAGIELRAWTSPGLRASRDPSAHDSLEVAWIDRGTATFTIGSKTTALRPGAVMVVPSHVEHSTGFDGPTAGRALGIPRALVRDVADRIPVLASGFDLPDAALDGTRRLTALCSMLDAECTADTMGDAVAARGLAEALVVEILRRHAQHESPPPRAGRRIDVARDRIHSEYADALTVKSLAETAGLSRYHFSRLFSQQTGKSPQAYLSAVRLGEAARRLAADPGASITATALDVGIGDPSRFARMFKAAYGVTPSEYRRQRNKARTQR